jgi:hypothetical protein
VRILFHSLFEALTHVRICRPNTMYVPPAVVFPNVSTIVRKPTSIQWRFVSLSDSLSVLLTESADN